MCNEYISSLLASSSLFFICGVCDSAPICLFFSLSSFWKGGTFTTVGSIPWPMRASIGLQFAHIPCAMHFAGLKWTWVRALWQVSPHSWTDLPSLAETCVHLTCCMRCASIVFVSSDVFFSSIEGRREVNMFDIDVYASYLLHKVCQHCLCIIRCVFSSIEGRPEVDMFDILFRIVSIQICAPLLLWTGTR